MTGFLIAPKQAWNFPVRKTNRLIIACAECLEPVKRKFIGHDDVLYYCENCHQFEPVTIEMSEHELEEMRR